MAVVVIQEFEATTDEYDAVNEKLDAANNPPEGVILHSASEIGGGKMRTVDVWQSIDAFQKFVQERLIPTIAQVNPDAPQPDEPDIREIHDLVVP